MNKLWQLIIVGLFFVVPALAGAQEELEPSSSSEEGLEVIGEQAASSEAATEQEVSTEASSTVSVEAEAEPEEDELSALDFIRQRKALTEGTPALRQRGRHRSGRPAPVAGPIEDLLQQLRDLLAHAAVTRKTRGEEWVRLQITPDIEIHVRGHLSSEQLAGFEELSDMMRHILLGRSEL